MKPRKPIARSPIRKRRKPRAQITIGKLGRIRLTGEALTKLRRDCFKRDGWKCRECAYGIQWEGWNAGHMAHIKSRGAGGSDVIENVRTLCGWCHTKEHNAGGHPVPKKAMAA